MEPNQDKTGVFFGVQNDGPVNGGNAAQRREHDKRIGSGTMSRSGALCPCCGVIMTMEDIRLEGKAGRLDTLMTAVVVDGLKGKEYRRPTAHEIEAAPCTEDEVEKVFADIPFGLPTEHTPKGGSGASRAFSVDGYGIDMWYKLFTPRQLFAISTFVNCIRALPKALKAHDYTDGWRESISTYLACSLDFLVNRNSTVCSWTLTRETTRGTFARFALPITWDFAEADPIEESSGEYKSSCSAWFCN